MYTEYDSIYIKFKNRQNESLVLEVTGYLWGRVELMTGKGLLEGSGVPGMLVHPWWLHTCIHFFKFH